MDFPPWQRGEPALEPILRKAAQVAVPVIVLGEYRYGIALSRERKRYEQWLSEYLPKFRILDVDERTTTSYAAVRMELRKAGTPIPSNDVWVAALCRQQLPAYREPRPTFRRCAGAHKVRLVM
jgi:tRNA(fMet)-specific endonuclease VapC